MIKITPCTPPPFNAAGIEVKALYFSQSPGEKFISVYARYREGQSWAPLHIGLPSIPTLQQVRDLDRNISLDSGSYNNAHIYLRSAAGNNMTTALFTNEEGGGIQVGNVDGLSALNLQPDGGLLTYGGNEVATRNWVNGNGFLKTETDPEWNAAKPRTLTYIGLLPNASDLNDYTIGGIYYQTEAAYAAAGANYPVNAKGVLEVTSDGFGAVYQTYHSFAENEGWWMRSKWASTWSPWQKMITNNTLTSGTGFLYANGSTLSFDNSTFIKASVNWGPNMASALQNSILYHYGSEPDNPSGGSTGYSINGSVGGISSIQLFLATGDVSGINPDGFYWRGNNAGGPGWPGPWRQVASREWVAANFLSLSNVINAQYASAQNANFWISGSARAQHFVANSLGYAMTAQSGYYGFFTDTGLSTALPVKAKEMVLSDSYADVAPANGLFVKGSIKTGSLTNGMLKTVAGVLAQAVAGTDYLQPGGVVQNQNVTTQTASFKINGTGESTTTLAAPTVKTNMIMPNSGSSITFDGDVILSTVASNLLKVDVTGKIVGAIANSDYVEYVSENILSVNSSQALSLAATFPAASTSACIIYCDTSGGNIILDLPAALGIAGKGPICFIKTDNSGNKVVIKGAGTTLINNSNIHELLTQFQKAIIRGGDGGQYWLF
jgi:hypothetical protein